MGRKLMAGELTLVLGVLDAPYSGPPQPPRKVAKARKGKQKPRGKAKGSSPLPSTGDVAQILEAKYEIMATFAEAYMPEIGEALAQSVAGAITALVGGASPDQNPFGQAESEIQQGFAVFLDQQEMDGRAGVPTKAALRGVNHSLLHPYARRAPRPSFVDTGIYRSHFRAWIET